MSRVTETPGPPLMTTERHIDHWHSSGDYKAEPNDDDYEGCYDNASQNNMENRFNQEPPVITSQFVFLSICSSHHLFAYLFSLQI